MQQLLASILRNWRALQFFPNRIDNPHPRLLSELRSKPKSILPSTQPRGFVRRPPYRHFRLRTGPFLVRKFRRVQTNRIVETRDKTVRVGNQINRGALMRDQPLPINFKFVLLRFAAKDRMILQDQASFPRPRQSLKKEPSAKSADAAAHHNAIVYFSGVDRIGQKGTVCA